MIKIFRKIRQNLLSEGKTKKYFKYAIGEIILVVIGILIALQINNWNEQRKKSVELSQINERLIIDLENDINELTANLSFWNAKKPLFEKVMHDSTTIAHFDEGLSRLLVLNRKTALNKTGVEQLKALNVKDNLSLQIVDIYNRMEKRLVVPYDELIDNNFKALLDIFRDKYPWFPEYVSKTIMSDNSSKALQDYFLTSMEYKNYVSSGYQVIYTNYVRFLEFTIPYLEDLRAQLIKNNNSQYHNISSEVLKAYEGEYALTKTERNGVEIENKDTISIMVRTNFLRVIPNSNPNQFTDYFYQNAKTFHSTSNGQQATAIVQFDNQLNVLGFITTIKVNQDVIVVHATKLNMESEKQ